MSKLILFRMTDEAGDEHELHLPAKMVVCHECDGHGTRVNPAIDGNGISREQFDEDPEFKEAYFRGDYDVPCPLCKGENVMPELDREQAATNHADEYKIFLECEKASQENARFEREYRAERDAERRMGA